MPKVERMCLRCGAAMLVSANDVRRGFGNYCSHACRNIARDTGIKRTAFTAEHRHNLSIAHRGAVPWNKQPRMTKPCLTCGAPFQVERRWFEAYKFCGSKCRFEWYRTRQTGIEESVQRILEEIGLGFAVHHRIGKYVLDFFLPDHAVAIECDGSYWHSRADAISRDARKDVFLGAQGIRVLRLPEKQIRSAIEECRRRVMDAVHA